MKAPGAMHRVAGVALLTAALWSSTGCDDENPTQVMVFVQAEDGVRARATRLEIRIEGGPAEGNRELRDTLVYTDPSSDEGLDLRWPTRVALKPEGGDGTRTFRVAATAQDATGLVAEARIVGGYLPAEALALHLWLRDACIGVGCPAEETCVAGECVAVPQSDPCSLDTLDGHRPSGCEAADAGATDAARMDAGDAGDTSEDAGANPADRHNVVFVTSHRYPPGELGGLEGADALCRERAAAGGLPRPDDYVAWLSDDATHAKDRLIGSRGWVRTDGRPVADTVDELTSGIMYYPPALDEHGVRPAPSQASVVTGTDNDGERQLSAYRCDEWTNDSGSLNIWQGTALDATGRWSTRGVLGSCDTAMALLCFGTGRTEPLDPPHTTGSLAFLTKSGLPGQADEDPDGGTPMGIERFDRLCQDEAEAEGHTGTFVALLGTTSEAAVNRLPSTAAPWVRPDGVVVAESKLDIANERLLAPVVLTVDGVDYANREIWAGAPDPGNAAAADYNCNDWTDGGFGATGIGGSTYRPFVDTHQTCGGSRPVFCFQIGTD
ncbi:MAG: hypothetical protein ACOC97_05225 [Myxococcota bacterium]